MHSRLKRKDMEMKTYLKGMLVVQNLNNEIDLTLEIFFFIVWQ
jgi:hypothetical protein